MSHIVDHCGKIIRGKHGEMKHWYIYSCKPNRSRASNVGRVSASDIGQKGLISKDTEFRRTQVI